MNPEYALSVLRQEKQNLMRLLTVGRLMGKDTTKIKHQMASIDFAIEVLKEYMD